MARSYWLVGAASACLFFVAGCTLDSFSLTALGAAKGDGPVLAGSLDATAVTAQKALGEMGLFVSVHRDSDVVKLTSTTAGGKRFTLVLKARKTDHGDETQVSIQWEKDGDDAFWIQLAGVLTRPQPTPSSKWDGDKSFVPTEGPSTR
jgi:hypothetical protein